MVHTIIEGGRARKRRIVVAGEMLELGVDEAKLHREAGRDIARTGIDILWGVRGLAKELVAGASEAGVSATRFFEDSGAAASAILEELKGGDLVLVKGSRGVATDKVVSAIRKHFPLLGGDERV
jgi:UDP-N-acetylmuramoyl-tripeptide--D-alanyl-D-alanine ligase